MPPLPKPNTGGTAKKGSRRPSTGTRERAVRPESSSAPSGPSPRSRTTKADALQQQLARMYMMIGTMVMPFGRFYPVLGPVGNNLREMSDEAAEAWMDLAAKDSRVKEILESITGASTWGNVIGIHLAIFASALPGGQYIQQVTSQEYDDEFQRQGKAMGMTDEEIELAKAEMFRQQNMPARDTSTGGPGDTVATPPPPGYSGEQATATAAPATGQSRAGIVTPDQLGVTQPGEDGTFPADTQPPNGRGAVQ